MFNVITFRGWKNMHGFKELKLEMTKLRKQMMSVLSKCLQSRKETVWSCTIFLSFFFSYLRGISFVATIFTRITMKLNKRIKGEGWTQVFVKCYSSIEGTYNWLGGYVCTHTHYRDRIE